jgi:hypothetical protein
VYAEGSRGGWRRREPGIMSNMLVRGKREKFMMAEAACAPGTKRTLGEEGSASCWLCVRHARPRIVWDGRSLSCKIDQINRAAEDDELYVGIG